MRRIVARPLIGHPLEVPEAMSQLRSIRRFRHPVNLAMEADAPRGAIVADRVTGFLGSWRFVTLQTAIVIGWIVGNIVLLFRFDPFPFILLNLAFSTQAAYAAPLILLAGNRAAQRDRMTLEHAASQADVEERQNEELLLGTRQILERVERLELTILTLERAIQASLERPDGSTGGTDPQA